VKESEAENKEQTPISQKDIPTAVHDAFVEQGATEHSSHSDGAGYVRRFVGGLNIEPNAVLALGDDDFCYLSVYDSLGECAVETSYKHIRDELYVGHIDDIEAALSILLERDDCRLESGDEERFEPLRTERCGPSRDEIIRDLRHCHRHIIDDADEIYETNHNNIEVRHTAAVGEVIIQLSSKFAWKMNESNEVDEMLSDDEARRI
jgi:hypothetical protein